MKRRTKRTLLWTTVAATALGIGAYVAEPTVRDELVARDVCDGAVSESVVKQLTPDDLHLKEAREQRLALLGTYTCTLTAQQRERDAKDWPLLRMEAYTRGDDQDRVMYASFPQFGTEYHQMLPGELPGFVDRVQNIVMRVPCRGTATPNSMLTRVAVARDALHGVPGAAYRAAVSFTNAAARRVGCEAAPLKVPGAAARAPLADPGARDADESRAPSVSVPDAGRTACGWVSTVRLPHARDWSVSASGGPAAMLASCTLDGPDPGTQGVTLHATYGNWGTRFLSRDSHSGVRDPMTATARCDGTRANFSLTTAEGSVSSATQRRLLRAFVEDQMRRDGRCTGEPDFTF
ncbi:hypothetical protein ACIRF8_26000 [Streptomyces sp. NPDC102406]|uniref:hypothetical protein n=1 Tax=Streptomyces sp. NPDC102406 TaxID=3366171 RepID=UPI003829EFFD